MDQAKGPARRSLMGAKGFHVPQNLSGEVPHLGRGGSCIFPAVAEALAREHGKEKPVPSPASPSRALFLRRVTGRTVS